MRRFCIECLTHIAQHALGPNMPDNTDASQTTSGGPQEGWIGIGTEGAFVEQYRNTEKAERDLDAVTGAASGTTTGVASGTTTGNASARTKRGHKYRAKRREARAAEKAETAESSQ